MTMNRNYDRVSASVVSTINDYSYNIILSSNDTSSKASDNPSIIDPPINEEDHPEENINNPGEYSTNIISLINVSDTSSINNFNKLYTSDSFIVTSF